MVHFAHLGNHEETRLVESVHALLETMTPDGRRDFLEKLIAGFCTHCGDRQPPDSICQCTNDE